MAFDPETALSILGTILAPLTLSALLYIDYYLIEHRVKGEINNRGFQAFSRVMQLGYFNRILVFVFQISIAINIDLDTETAPLLIALFLLPSVVISIAMAIHNHMDTEVLGAQPTSSWRERTLLYIAYATFCASWSLPIAINMINSDLKSVAMTSVTLANGVSGFIIAFVQEPILQRAATSREKLYGLLKELRQIRQHVSLAFLVIILIILISGVI